MASGMWFGDIPSCCCLTCSAWRSPNHGGIGRLHTNIFSFAGQGLDQIPSYYVDGELGADVETQSVTGPNTETKTDLYKILENANLLSYYETFVEIGADDITQLFDTCGDDFVEAIEVSGMALKPLHVRRLERALNDWQHKQGKIRIIIGQCIRCTFKVFDWYA